MEEVSDRKALEVIESTLLPETLSKYCAAYLSGKTISDGVYQTVFMYKIKCTYSVGSPKDIMDKHFPIPNKQKSIQTKINLKHNYFVIIADEVYQQKKLKQEEKEQKAFEKELRKIERENKLQLKLKQLQSLQESESDSSDSDWSMSPAYPGRDCVEEDASNLLNETKNKLSRKCKTGEKEYKDQRETDEQETARKRTRLSEVYVVGEYVEALWQDKDPELRTFFRAKIQHMISSDLYKVIFEDGCQRFVKRKEIKKL